MNQDQLKDILLRIEEPVEEVTVIFSGKTSKKVNGLYRPDSREIIIHNRNFETPNQIVYTGIHEYAHHIHFTTAAVPVTSRAHTIEFRSILHRLLSRAEELGLYENVFAREPAFAALTERIRTEFLSKNGALMKRFGEALFQAQRLCSDHRARFEDYVERVLALDMAVAKTVMQFHSLDLPEELGYERMKTVVGLRKEADRTAAISALMEGATPDSVKARFRAPVEDDDPVEKLAAEKRRIERTIESLTRRLLEVESRLRSMGGP